MSKIVLTPVTNGQNVSSINSNFTEIARQLNDLVLYRDNPASQANQVKQDVDFNGNNLLNVGLVDATDFTIGGASLDQGLVATVTAAAATAVAASVVSVNAAANATAITAGALQKTNNLSDLQSIATAKGNLALDQVSNTSDANKPVSTAQAATLAPKASPVFTGTPTAPTPAIADSSTTIPTTAYVQLQFQNAQTPVFATSTVTRGAAATSRGYYIYTNTTARWSIVASSAAESGSNVGSDLLIGRYNDAGAFIDLPIQITRSTGNVALVGNITAQNAVIGNASTQGNAQIVGPNGQTRGMQLFTGANARWYVFADSATESGANVGSDFRIARYNDAGTFIDQPLTINRSTGQVDLRGRGSGVNPGTGIVGEILTSTATGTAYGSSTATNLVTIGLTAGIWDVEGVVNYIPAATTNLLRCQQGISTTSATMAGLGTFTTYFVQAVNSGNPNFATPKVRIALSGSANVFLVGLSVFTVSTIAADGFIRATRVA